MLRPDSAGQHGRRSPAAAPRGDRGPAAGAATPADGDLRRGRREPPAGQGVGPARIAARVPGALVRWLDAERPRAGRDRQGPRDSWEAAIDGEGPGSAARMRPARNPRCTHPACWIKEAHVAKLTGLLREGPTPPTGSTPTLRTSSAPGRTSAWDISPRTTTKSTRPGWTPR